MCLKLLIVVPSLGPVYGGTSKCIVELAQALGLQGVEVDIVTTNANGKTVLDVPTHTWIEEDTHRTLYFPYVGIGDYKLSWSLAKWLFFHIKDYDLVQTNAIFSLTNLPAYWSCLLKKISYVVVPHGMLDPWALSYKSWKKTVYYQLLEKRALKKASSLQMLSLSESEKIQSLKLETPITIAPNGIHRQDFDIAIDPEIFYKAFPETRNKILILFLGRIDPKKGLDLLAEAFGKLYEDFPNIHLVVAGPDNINFLPTVKGYFSAKNCIDAVTFTGMLTGLCKYAALAASDIYTAPSYSEGFSVSILEGMAAGLPCIITTGCNFPEASAVKAAYVVDCNSNDLAVALRKVLQDPAAAAAVGKAASQFIFENYTWDKIATNLRQNYQSIIEK